MTEPQMRSIHLKEEIQSVMVGGKLELDGLGCSLSSDIVAVISPELLTFSESVSYLYNEDHSIPPIPPHHQFVSGGLNELMRMSRFRTSAWNMGNII